MHEDDELERQAGKAEPEQAEPAGEPAGAEQAEPAGEPAEPIDWKAEARKWQARSRANLKAAREAQAALDERADYDAIKSELEGLRAERERAGLVAKAAAEHGVDAGLLSRMAGDVEENARYLASLPRYAPVRDEGGLGAGGAKPTAAELFARALNGDID